MPLSGFNEVKGFNHDSPDFNRDALKPVFSIKKKPHKQEVFMELRVPNMTLLTSSRDALKQVYLK